MAAARLRTGRLPKHRSAGGSVLGHTRTWPAPSATASGTAGPLSHALARGGVPRSGGPWLRLAYPLDLLGPRHLQPVMVREVGAALIRSHLAVGGRGDCDLAGCEGLVGAGAPCPG